MKFSMKPVYNLDLAQCASGALITYLESTQKVDLKHIEKSEYKIEQYMMLDSTQKKPGDY